MNRILTSNEAMKGYRTGYFTYNDLLKVRPSKAKVQTSDKALDLYEKGNLKFKNLKKKSPQKILEEVIIHLDL